MIVGFEGNSPSQMTLIAIDGERMSIAGPRNSTACQYALETAPSW